MTEKATTVTIDPRAAYVEVSIDAEHHRTRRLVLANENLRLQETIRAQEAEIARLNEELAGLRAAPGKKGK